MKMLNSVGVITSVTVLSLLVVAVEPVYAADRYLDMSASAGLQGLPKTTWTNAIWSVDLGGTNRVNIASNDNVFVQVETDKSLGTLSIPAVPAGTQYYVNDLTVGNSNIVMIGSQNFGFNIAGNITVQEQSKLSWDGSGVFAFKPKTTTAVTIQGSSTNVYNAGASAKSYTMGSLIFGDGYNKLALAADQTLTFSNISGGSSNVIDLGSNSAAGFVINTTGACVFDGVISGSGTLEKKGGGTLALGGPNTFSGETTLSGGTLVISNQLALQNSSLSGNTSGAKIEFGAGITEFTLGGLGLGGNIDVALTNQSGAAVRLKVGKNNASKTCNGALSESGGLTKIGNGTLTLATGPHTYTGDTVIEAGTLVFTSTLGGGTYNGSISNEGTLVWNTVTSQTFNGIMSGGGNLVKLNSTATLILNATNTYSGATIISNGILKVTNTGSLSTNTALTVAGTNSAVNLNGKAQSCVSVGGTGFVTNGTLTVTAALYPGGSNVVGTLTVSNLIVSAGTAVYWDYGAGGTDTNKVLGVATLPENATVYVSGSDTLPTRAVLFNCGSIVAPSGVGGWSVVGARPNSRVSIQGNQLLLLNSSGTLISLF